MAPQTVTPNTSNPYNFPVYPAEVYLTNEFWLKKMSYFLDYIDIDQNGQLSQNDKDLWVTRTIAEISKPLSPEEVQAFKTGVDHAWEWYGLMPDGPPITKKESIKHMAEVTLQPGCVEHIKTISDRWFNLLDEDQDGVVSWKEFLKMQKGVGRDLSADAKVCFEAIDEDGNGAISKDEWGAAARGFFIGIDPKSPSRLFWCDFDKVEASVEVPALA
ncbi:hypothetical protein KFL_006760030 [Klebsormidium nitens]|uniref:EF-hand domain-containing protein n=1 Tax=Klebsormidium nitens TaxID=105231 RepID=A0A1Y1IIT5_KLENI|nr:hypothetical protein KFL_006760030 [Klebsormidium nitens]|eukprot:GAQ90704.1 hypothetical protein KFL_006760030 [Klebsormidium nitens]